MWYFAISAEASMLVLQIPTFWAVLATFLALALAGIRFRPRTADHLDKNPASLVLLAAAPVLIVAFAIWQRAALAGKPDGFYWQDGVLYLLLAAQVLLAAWLVRRLKHRWLALLCGVLALWYTAGTLFVAGMAIPDVWL